MLRCDSPLPALSTAVVTLFNSISYMGIQGCHNIAKSQRVAFQVLSRAFTMCTTMKENINLSYLGAQKIKVLHLKKTKTIILFKK